MEVISAQERINKFGVDCGNRLQWKGGTWEPGGEYVRKLIVKNVTLRTIRLKYKLPPTKYFSMDFPETIRLSPGMQRSLDVIFRPVHAQPYDDVIEFSTDNGEFIVPISARLAKLRIDFPKDIQFGACPVKEHSEQRFTIANTGQVPVDFSFDLEEPFSIMPDSCHLEPGASTTITALFFPEIAQLFSMEVILNIHTDETQEIISFKGQSRYPYITTGIKSLEFGQVLAGDYLDKEFTLRNKSNVSTVFSIIRDESDVPSLFLFNPLSGSIPAFGSVTIKVRFQGTNAGNFCCDHFKISTPGGNTAKLTCRGEVVGPEVVLYQKSRSKALGVTKAKTQTLDPSGQAFPARLTTTHHSMCFGDVQLGKIATKALYLRNLSKKPATYQFLIDHCSPEFRFDKVQGTIPAEQEIFVTIYFQPERPINHFQRVFCLIRDSPAQSVDLIGTCYSDAVRPAPLRQKHVNAFLCRPVEAKLFAPDRIEKMIADDPELVMKWGNKYHDDRLTTEEHLTRSGQCSLSSLQTMHDLAIQNRRKDIEIQEGFLDFGMCSRYKNPEKRTVHVTNHSKAKVTCEWIVPLSFECVDETGKPVTGTELFKNFDVSPASQDISPGHTESFQIIFYPTKDNFYYLQHLQLIANYKINRTFRLVNEESFTPPWTRHLIAKGHTFSSEVGHFLPKISTSVTANTVQFPACHLGEVTHRTIQLHNSGDVPTFFEFPKDPSGIFTAIPSHGLIQRNKFQLVVLSFKPLESRKYKHQMQCVFNHSEENSMEFALNGFGEKPFICPESDDIYFKPCNLGTSTSRTFSLINKKRTPVRIQWNIPTDLASNFHVSPETAIIRGNDTLECEMQFAPTTKDSLFVGKMDVLFSSVLSPEILGRRRMKEVPRLEGDIIDEDVLPKKVGNTLGLKLCEDRFHFSDKLSVRVVGECTSAILKFDPPLLDFNTVLVGTVDTQTIHLVNSSEGDVCFKLRYKIVKQRRMSAIGNKLILEDDASMTSPKNASQPTIKITPSDGIVKARSKKPIKIRFSPSDAGDFKFAIFWSIESTDSSKTLLRNASIFNDTVTEGKGCDVIANAGFPTVRFIDIRANPETPDALWQMFSLRELNEELLMPLTKRELVYNSMTELEQDPKELKQFNFSFAPCTVGSPTAVIYLRLKNIGHLGTTAEIKFPNESPVEVERWADVGEPTSQELKLNSIIESKVFDVQPRRAVLSDQEEVTFRISYSYTMLAHEGRHDIPLVLRLSKGKQLSLVLKGRTLPIETPLVHALPSTGNYYLNKVAVGCANPPVQTIMLHNAGDVGVSYTLEYEDSLKEILKESQDFKVFEVLKTSGHVSAGRPLPIQLKFCPFKAKEYRLKMRLKYVSELIEDSCEFEIVAEGFIATPKTAQIPLPMDDNENAGIFPPWSHLCGLNGLTDNIIRRSFLSPEDAADRVLPKSGDEPLKLLDLSSDVVDFGPVPEGSVSWRLLVLRNVAPFPIRFQFENDSELFSKKMLKLHPRVGKLVPNEVTVIKYSFTATSLVQLISEYIACRVWPAESDEKIDEKENRGPYTMSYSAMSGRHSNPQFNTSHASVVGRSTMSFSRRMRDNGQVADDTQNFDGDNVQDRSGVPDLGETGSMMRSASGMRSVSAMRSASAARSVSGLGAPSRPEPLHLGRRVCVRIRALIVKENDFDEMYGDSNAFFHPCLQPQTRPNLKLDSEAVDIIGDIMKEIMQEVTQHKDIRYALETSEPNIPYFTQIDRNMVPDFAIKFSEEELEQQDTIADPECQEFTTRILENTVFNIIQELVEEEEAEKAKMKEKEDLFADHLPDTIIEEEDEGPMYQVL
eukprot:TRINITY_DN3241_c0_g1_i4.p1 TRINITY_DN3241_c0_g1~~TRINITY_DN3241_c0_g1_i4.p1  ORF type:complete len:1819 (-),score=545.80 TRINITY_DN3241_c0_g1_i4:87-5543(-)